MGNAILLQFTGKNNPRWLGGRPGKLQETSEDLETGGIVFYEYYIRRPAAGKAS